MTGLGGKKVRWHSSSKRRRNLSPTLTAMQYYTPQHNQVAALEIAGTETSASLTHRNFLFLMPGTVSELERSIVMVAARRMTESGYVYMAVEGQKEMEDRDGVRFLPLNDENLPAFGLMTTVVVLHHNELAEFALETYPDAQVFLLNPRAVDSSQDSATPAATEGNHYFSHLRPWLMTGQMSSIRQRAQPTLISIPSAMGLAARGALAMA